MTNTAITSVSSAVSIVLTITSSVLFARYRRDQVQTDVSCDPWQGLPISAFSIPDHSVLADSEEAINPLVEAEIYLIYGRRKDAQAVLEHGLSEGRVTAEEIARFWASVETKSAR